MADEYEKDYLGKFEDTAKERHALLLWLEYFVGTETYDRIVCTGPIGLDGILPANNTQRMAIEQNARDRLKALRLDAERHGITDEQLRKGRRAAHQMDFDRQKVELGRLRERFGYPQKKK